MPAPSIGNHDDQQDAYRCTHCSRLLFADELERFACRVCEDRAREQLGAMPGLYQQLGSLLQPGATPSNGGPVSGATKTPPLPVNVAALDLRANGGMVSLLLDIEDSWRRQLGWTIAGFRGDFEQTLAAVVPVLVNAIGWACSDYEDVADDLATIRRLHNQASQLVTGNREQRVPLGCCPARDEQSGAVCGSRLQVSPWALRISCGSCGSSWPRDEWLRLGAAMRGFPVPGASVA